MDEPIPAVLDYRAIALGALSDIARGIGEPHKSAEGKDWLTFSERIEAATAILDFLNKEAGGDGLDCVKDRETAGIAEED